MFVKFLFLLGSAFGRFDSFYAGGGGNYTLLQKSSFVFDTNYDPTSSSYKQHNVVNSESDSSLESVFGKKMGLDFFVGKLFLRKGSYFGFELIADVFLERYQNDSGFSDQNSLNFAYKSSGDYYKRFSAEFRITPMAFRFSNVLLMPYFGLGIAFNKENIKITSKSSSDVKSTYADKDVAFKQLQLSLGFCTVIAFGRRMGCRIDVNSVTTPSFNRFGLSNNFELSSSDSKGILNFAYNSLKVSLSFFAMI